MEWYRREFRIGDPPTDFFDVLDELRLNPWIPSGSACSLGKGFPSSLRMRVWLCFTPQAPAQFLAFVASSGLTPADPPAEIDGSISWTELFAISQVDAGRERTQAARPGTQSFAMTPLAAHCPGSN
jgi:hypothetical protein